MDTAPGAFGRAEDERHDVRAIIDFEAQRGLPDVWLVGWSFDTDLA